MKILTCLLTVLCCAFFSCKNENAATAAATDAATTTSSGSITTTDTKPGELTDGRTTPLSTKEKLMGEWRSVTDEKYVLVFADDRRFTGKYDGKEIETGKWEAPDQCACEMPTEKGCIMMSTTEVFCNALLELTPDRLSYALVGGAGKTQAFTRVK